MLAAAADVFSRNGYASSSIDDIALAAGVTRATIYYHFASKESIYTSIVVAYATDWRQRVESTLAGSSTCPAKKLAALMHDLVAATLDPRTKRLHYDQYIRISESSREIIRSAQHAFSTALATVITEAQHEGQAHPGDARFLGLAVFEAIGRVPVWYNFDGRVGVAEAAQTLSTFFLRGFLTSEGMRHALE
ncbi:hypothetical protein AYO38_11785 [bacterium SCGC AG-212-C10]|nr:hypothetical protein AYO38_11785 [bacterium SCGC AG-212-C10]